jgi:hypothetical protein
VGWGGGSEEGDIKYKNKVPHRNKENNNNGPYLHALDKRKEPSLN